MDLAMVITIIWMAAGAIAFFIVANQEGESPEQWIFGVFLLLGPLVLLGILYAKISSHKDKEPRPRKVDKSNTAKKMAKKKVLSKVNSDDLLHEYEGLIEELSSIFVHAENTPTKSDFVKLQRLVTLLSNPELDSKLDKDTMSELVNSGLDAIEDVYGEDDSVGIKRQKSLEKALLKLHPGQSKKRKKTTKKPADNAEIGKFGFPFDVDKFTEVFPNEWSLVNDYSKDDGALILGSDNNRIVAAPHKISSRKSLAEHVSGFASFCEEHSEIIEHETTLGTKLWALTFRYKEDDELKSAFMVEVMGPALMSVRFIYYSENMEQAVIDALIDAVQNLRWYGDLAQTSDAGKNLSLKDLKHLVRKELKGHTEQKEGLLSTFEDEDYVDLYPFQIEELIELGTEYYPLATALIWFALRHSEISSEDSCEFSKMCDAGCFNSPELQRMLIEQAETDASSSDDYLALAELMVLKVAGMKSGEEYFQKAVAAVKDVSDIWAVLGSSLADGDTFSKMYALLGSNLGNEDFVGSIYNPVDMLELAKDRDLISADKQRQGLEMLLQSSSKVLPFMAMVSSIYDEELSDIRDAFLIKAMNQATTSENKYEIYRFINDELEDEKRASEYFEENRDQLSALQVEKEQAEGQNQIIDVICQCALLVSAGDGSISEEESEKVGQTRAIVENIFRNRHAIELLEETEDIEKAREVRSENILIHTLNLFPPEYHHEVIKHLQELQSPDEFIALVKLYAAKIEDPFAKKIAAWAAQEIAAIDGLDDGELHVLSVMADVWELDLKENSRFIERIVGPIISDEIEFTGKGSTDKQLLADARALDEMLKDEENSELAETLAELLGVTSIEEMAKKIHDIDDEEEFEESEENPKIFEILNETQGDWEQVGAAAEKGVDVNAAVNMQGLASLSILILAVEQAPTSVVKQLVEAGADINHCLLNLRKSTGYNNPLVTSLKGGGRMDVFDYLLEAGANPDPFTDKESGWTPLTIAAMNHNYEAIKTLLAKGADPNVATSDERTAFKIAIGQTEHPEALKCAKALLKAGADPLRLDNDGFAGIHNAACEGSVEWIKFLIEQADVPVDYSIKSLKGAHHHTPLLRAMNRGNLSVVDYLLSKGANINARNGNRSIFSAIMTSAKNKELDEPLAQMNRFFDLGAEPKFSDVMNVLEEMEKMDDETDSWCIDVADALLKAGKFDQKSLDELDSEELEKIIDKAVNNAPELTEKFLDLLEKNNLYIHNISEGHDSRAILDHHFQYQNDIQLHYKDRKNPESLEKAISACRDQIALGDRALDAFRDLNMPIPEHYGYKQLAIILAKQGKYSEVVDLCQQAKAQGWVGDWDKRSNKCRGKM